MPAIQFEGIELFDRLQFDLNLNRIPTTRGFRHEAVLVHKGLMKQRSISSTDEDVLNQKIFAQIRVWDEAWKKQVEKNQENQKREKLRLDE
jgi:hypothetical protein